MDINSTLIVDYHKERLSANNYGQQVYKDYQPLDGDPAGETVRLIAPTPPTAGSYRLTLRVLR
jgi:hypothetical protein